MIRPGQLLIIDEASLAGTLTLDAITAQAREAGAKVLLVGDWAQLGAVEAGGAFAMLARDRSDVPQLNEVHRFTHNWERDASAAAARRRPGRASTPTPPTTGSATATATTCSTPSTRAWRHDTDHGLESLMIAADRHAVDRPQPARPGRPDRRRPRLRAAGPDRRRRPPASATASSPDATTARLRTPGGWVKNGDSWTITSTGRDGSLHVRSRRRRPRSRCPPTTSANTSNSATPPPPTAPKAAPSTPLTPSSTPPARAKSSTSPRPEDARPTRIYVDTTATDDQDTSHGPAVESPAAAVLQRVLDNTSADTAAHDAYATEVGEALERARRNQPQHDPFPREPWTPMDQSPSMYHGIGY